MDQAYYNRLFNFLWNIANDVLVQNVEKGDYKKIILPFIVLRRLDLLLEQTKKTVLDFVNDEDFRDLPLESQSEQLYAATGYPFYNTSPFRIKSNEVPSHKIGKLWKFKRFELDDWVNSGKSAK